MTRLVLATGNRGKLREFGAALAGLGLELILASDAGVTHFPEETGAAYEENAFIKAAYAAHRSGLPSLADDSGLEVAALNGAPGVHSARYGGEMTDGERVAYLLKQLVKTKDARQAKFVCSLVLATPAGEAQSFYGECHGILLEGPRGEGGFGYDPIFYSVDLKKTFAEASTEEKQAVSHRGRALAALKRWLLEGGQLLQKP